VFQDNSAAIDITHIPKSVDDRGEIGFFLFRLGGMPQYSNVRNISGRLSPRQHRPHRYDTA
jgi:hypothetical protein